MVGRQRLLGRLGGSALPSLRRPGADRAGDAVLRGELQELVEHLAQLIVGHRGQFDGLSGD
ncbi:hypothetical protein, partial [Mesorhizobium japonicum]|uniref:hypothetical protein n=1 Tax=Mesorhizobium japonicum TaxID=2066070 RepID=UPI003B5B58FA